MNSAVRFLAGLALAGLTMAVDASISRNVDTAAGRVRGDAAVANDEVMVFRGIPYAAPPVGANRWRPPQPPEPFGRRFDALSYGARCQQASAVAGLSGPGFVGGAGVSFGPEGEVPVSEDCLNLNIWSGADDEASRRPVMVWIHGDELQRGAASDARFDGLELASRGIVVVSIDYRLGAYGFLAHPALTDEAGVSGNYGLLDAIAALAWVQRNIAAFGGDPDNVTVFSGSAGATMTAALIGSPEAAGLFDRAILQSGTWMGMGIAPMPTLAEAEQAGVAALGDLSAAELRALPVEQLDSALADPAIVVDGRVIPRDLAAVYADREQNAVDILVGSNRGEGLALHERSGIRTAAEYEAAVRQRLGPLADEYLRLYPSGSDALAVASNVTALGDEMAWQMRLLAGHQTGAGGSAYVYAFTRVPPATNTGITAANHESEVQYVFNNMGEYRAWTNGDRQLARVMGSYWINFAETGSPNGTNRWTGAELPLWPFYTGSDEFQAMEFGDRIGTNPIWQVEPVKYRLFDLIYAELVPAGTH